jgi:hypothetical protein
MSMPFEPFTPPPHRFDNRQDTPNGPTFQQAPPQPGKYGGPVDFTIPAKKAWGLWNLIALIVGAKAGWNHHNNGESVMDATGKGVGAYARWMCWSVALFVWGLLFVGFAAGGSNPQGDWYGIVACTLVWPFVFGVTWCRYVDYSLFRRGLWYRLFQPIEAACDKIPTPALYLGMILPLGALTL